ncbi:uncharacterized protein isoform X2 [Choristoneura fumiferana]
MHVLETKTKEVPVQFDVDTENLRDTDLKFPIESINDLETLENNLQDKNFELKLVTKFSKISGTNGMQTLRKFGIFLMSHIIKDECLHLCSWKGIKGCQKIPFVKFIRVRELIFKVVSLADKTCTYKDVDAFLQQSVIKHSNQRLKRKNIRISQN